MVKVGKQISLPHPGHVVPEVSAAEDGATLILLEIIQDIFDHSSLVTATKEPRGMLGNAGAFLCLLSGALNSVEYSSVRCYELTRNWIQLIDSILQKEFCILFHAHMRRAVSTGYTSHSHLHCHVLRAMQMPSEGADHKHRPKRDPPFPKPRITGFPPSSA